MADVVVSFGSGDNNVEVSTGNPHISWLLPFKQYEEYMRTGDISCFGDDPYISHISSTSLERAKETFKRVMKYLYKQNHYNDIDIMELRNATYLLFFVEDSYIYCKDMRTGEQVIVGKAGE